VRSVQTQGFGITAGRRTSQVVTLDQLAVTLQRWPTPKDSVEELFPGTRQLTLGHRPQLEAHDAAASVPGWRLFHT
jgi:hypothetical protein